MIKCINCEKYNIIKRSSHAMSLRIIKADITTLKVDAIVNAANKTLLGGGGVDGAIHWAAGAGLLDECKTLGGCNTGEAKITGGYKLPAKYVIHTVGPVWHGGNNNEAELLASCYRNSLKLAEEYKCESVAFPLISAGIFGYPVEDAINIAVENLSHSSLDVTLALFSDKLLELAKSLHPEFIS